MEETSKNLNAHTYGLQEYLSLGYLYLIILGIIENVIFYKFLGINILDYTPISDVLLTPINTLVQDLRVLFFTVVALTSTYFFYLKVLPRFHAMNRDKDWYNKMVKDPQKLEDKMLELRTRAQGKVVLVVIFMTCIFFGIRIGAGHAIRQRIEKGELKANHTLTFSDNTSKRVRIIGQNSSYILFLPEGQKEISIMPISGNVKEFKLLKK